MISAVVDTLGVGREEGTPGAGWVTLRNPELEGRTPETIRESDVP
jgi:hypothetical protein